MIDISKKSYYKYLLFGSLYFSEGLQGTIATVIIPIYLVEKGFPLTIATIVAALFMVPWTLKFFWGGVVDHYHKQGRKKFIVIGGISGAFGLFALSIIDPSSLLIPFLILLLLSHIGVAFLDVSADALAIEISRFEERGKINAAMFTGLFGGMLISGPLLGFIAYNYSYNFAFITGGFIILAILIYPLIIKEVTRAKKRPKIGKKLIHEYKKRPIQLISIFGPISSISGGIVMFGMPLYMNQVLNLNIGQIGLLNMVFPIGIIFGANIFGIVTDSMGRKKTLYIILSASIFFYGALVLINDWITIAIFYGAVGFFFGAYHAASGALLMDLTNPEIGATEYGLFTSLFNFGEMGGEFSSGTLISILGFSRVFLYSAWLFGPSLIILYFIRYKIDKNNKVKSLRN